MNYFSIHSGLAKRHFVFCLLSIVTGILSGILLQNSVLFAIPVLIVLLSLYKKKFFICILAALFLFSSISTWLNFKCEQDDIPHATVIGRVTGISNDSCRCITLSGCKTADGKDINNVLLYLFGEDVPCVGDTVKFTGDLSSIEANYRNRGDYFKKYALCADKTYYFASASNFEVLDSTLSPTVFFYSIRQSVYSKIFTNVNDSCLAGILYAFLTGDKTCISCGTYSFFSAAGMSHLLAVSGLHTGIFIFLLTFLIGLIRPIKKFEFYIVSVFLILFTAFCSFAPSVTRACLMAFIFILCRKLGFRYDLLSSLCFSACAILMFNPFRLFDPSFLLSFAAVLGICACPNIKSKNPTVRYLLSISLISLYAFIFTLGPSLYCFSSVSLLSVFCNILLLPIASVAISLTAIFIFLPGKLLNVPAFIIKCILSLCSCFQDVPKLKVVGFSFYLVILITVLLFLISKFLLLKKHIKLLVLTCFVVIFAALSVPEREVRLLSNTKSLCVNVSGRSQIFVGFDLENSFNTVKSYYDKNIYKIDYAFVLNEADVRSLLLAEAQGIKIGKIYMPKNFSMDSNTPATVLDSTVSIDGRVFFYADGGLYCNSSDGLMFFGGEDFDADFSFYFDSAPKMTEANSQITYSADTQGMITVKNKKATLWR